MSNPTNSIPARDGAGNPPLKPGDEAPPGTPGTGENICPVCHGKGTVRGSACTNCAGTGKVTTGIGGA